MIDEEGIQANAGKVGDVFITELMKLREEFEVVGDVRGRGLMLGLELVKSKVSGEEGPQWRRKMFCTRGLSINMHTSKRQYSKK